MPTTKIAQFLALSSISGFFEIGAIFLGLTFGGGLFPVILLALAYQLGTLAPYPLLMTKTGIGIFVPIGAVAGFLTALGPSHILGAFVFVLSVSLLINMSRGYLGKAEVSTSLKRSFRVVGFLLSPLIVFAPILLAVLAVTCLLSYRALSVFKPTGESERLNFEVNPTMAATLLAHQMHYFCYYCIVVTALLAAFGPFWGVVAFVAGWISYILVPHLVGQRFANERTALIGHLLLIPILVGLSVAESSDILTLFLWIMTGFFGGTVVFLTAYARSRFGFDEVSLATIENLGHCIGMGCALIWVSLNPQTKGLYGLAAALACLTAVLLSVAMRSESRKVEVC